MHLLYQGPYKTWLSILFRRRFKKNSTNQDTTDCGGHIWPTRTIYGNYSAHFNDAHRQVSVHLISVEVDQSSQLLYVAAMFIHLPERLKLSLETPSHRCFRPSFSLSTVSLENILSFYIKNLHKRSYLKLDKSQELLEGAITTGRGNVPLPIRKMYVDVIDTIPEMRLAFVNTFICERFKCWTNHKNCFRDPASWPSKLHKGHPI